jgi:fibronectin type 3 domain-containing protein
VKPPRFRGRFPDPKIASLVLCMAIALATWAPTQVSLAATSITFVQGGYTAPQSPQTRVSVKFSAAQVTGDLNVVVVGWNDSSARVSAIADTSGNPYVLATGPTVVSGFGSQSIYYAKNILAAAAGANTVTVTFSAAAAYPDIRILEYRGADPISPVDVTAAATGTSSTSSSGSATTTNPTDLIFGANLVATTTTGAGSGFTSRLLTAPDGDIAEDRTVSTTGSYSATAPVSPAARWIMQMVAFRTPSATTPTSTATPTQTSAPTATSTPTRTAVPTSTATRTAVPTVVPTNSPTPTPTSMPDTLPPGAPAGLATSVSGTQINLSWTAAVDNIAVASYQVERCQGAGCSSFTLLTTTPATTYANTGLAPGSYTYRVRASDAAGNLGPYSNVASGAIADTQPPTAPSGLNAAVSGTQISVTWTSSVDNIGVAGYQLERCRDAGCSAFAQIGTPTGLAYTDTNLAAGTYSYRARATDAAGNLSPYSNVASAVVGGALPGVVAAFGFGEGTGTTVADASGNGITGTLQGATWTAAGKYGSALSFNGTSSYVDLGSPAGLSGTGSMTLESWVFATASPFDDGQIVARSTDAVGWQLKTTPDTGRRTFGVAVSGPTGARAQRYGATVLSLNTWYHVAAVYNAAAQTLDIYVNGTLDNASLVGSVPSSQTLPSVNANIGRRSGGFNFVGSIDEVRIYSRALAPAEIQADMNSPVGEAAADTQPPTAPANLTTVASSGSRIDLQWTASTDNVGVVGYLIERCQNAGCTNFSQVGTTSTTRSYSDTALTPNTSYSYRVRATDGAGNLSSYSTTATAVTPAPQAPTAPSALTATAVSTSEIDLTWAASTSTVGLANYLVERCAGKICETAFTQIASPVTTSYNDTGLPPSTRYSYQVRAIDTAGNLSPYSAVAGAITLDPQPPSAPTNLTASPVNGAQINLAWTASTSSFGVANYIVQRCAGPGCSAFVQLGTAPAAAYNDTGLNSGTSYSYQVQAVDTAGNLSPFSNIASATPLAGLAAAYSFDEGTGSTTADSSGNGIVGTIHNATWTLGGRYGDALSFSGANSFVDLGRPVSLTTTSSMSWEAWVFPTTNPGDDGNIIALSNGSNGWQFKTTPDTGVRTFGVAVSGASGSTAQRYSATTITLNTWYHVAGVYNAAARTLDVYVNGVLDNGSLVGAVPASQTLPGTESVAIGQRAAGFNFIGTIDEVRVYNRALSPAEIQNDMGAAFPKPIAAVTPATLDFGSQAVNTVSTQQVVTLTNTGDAPLLLTGVSVVGASAASFTSTSACPASVAPSASCTVSVTFTPQSPNAVSATLAFSDNASNSHLVTLAGTGTANGLSVSPRTSTLTPLLTQLFTAGASGVTWSVDGLVGGSAASGTITGAGLYTPPSSAGAHTVTATSADGTQTAAASVYVSTYPGAFSRSIDQARTGLNANETVLTTANVNSTRFGKLQTFATDGIADASPLYVSNVVIPGQGAHNIVYVATEHDSVYAFDADARQLPPLWKVSFIDPTNHITTVPSADTGECCDIAPEIGITGTPVIDPTTNTLFVVAKTKEVSGSTTTYVHRLHALDLATGAEKLGGPRVVQASVPGTGGGAVGGQVPFISLTQNQRPALLLNNGVVYIGFAAHGDVLPYHGWVLGYSATTLQQTMAFNTSPNDSGMQTPPWHGASGIWQSGDGLASDAAGNIYFVTGNGHFSPGTSDFGDSVVKINPLGALLDFFAPHDQLELAADDIDFGSGGVLLLPDQTGAHPHLAITAGKNGTIYVLDRDNLGHNNPTNDSQIVQSIPNIFPHGSYHTGNEKAPLYWNGRLYFSAVEDNLKSFALTNGRVSTSPTSQSAFVANYPGATMALSASGNTTGILWVVQRIDVDPTGAGVRGPGILRAFDANNLGTELYNSTQVTSRDGLDFAAKAAVPIVANGKVFVASVSQLTIYGLLP